MLVAGGLHGVQASTGATFPTGNVGASIITNRTFLGGVRIIVIVLYTPIPYSGPILIVKGTEYQDLEFGVNG